MFHRDLSAAGEASGMCRLAAYLGHPLLISHLVTEPAHSLVHQSQHSRERREPLNGDGFGVAWFVPEAGSVPAVFREVTPAWNNENLTEIARVTSSRCIFAHVRAASPGSPVHRYNCHPFVIDTLAFMHNGFLAGFESWRRALLAQLSDEAFAALRGSTDSEHAFALLWDFYRRLSGDPAERLVQALAMTITRLEELKAAAGITQPSYCNMAVSDGERVVAARYSSAGDENTASLHYVTGSCLRCHDGQLLHDRDAEDPDFVIIASEGTNPQFCWETVPVNHMVLAQHPGSVELTPI